LVGDQPCQQTELSDFYVYCTVDACIEGEAICVCGCGEYDLTQTFCGNPTTLGGIFCLDPNVAPNVSPPNPSIMVTGDILEYDPATVTDVTTVSVKYSVGNADAGGTCVDVGTTTITLVPKPNVDFDLPDGPLCTTNADISIEDYLTGETIANGTIDFIQLSDFAGNPVMAPVTTVGANYVIPVSTLAPGDYSVTYTELVTGGGQDCLATQTEYFSVLPGGDPSWTNPSPVCADGAPFVLMPDNAPIPGTPASWSGPGITDNTDVAAGVYTADFNPPASGVYTITFCVGDGICEQCLTQAIEVFACVDAETVDDDIVCASSSNCYDLEQQFEPTTTPGGVWGNLLDVSGNAGAVTLNGTNVCYDPTTLTEATTISVDYSVVAYPGATGCCIGLSTTQITLYRRCRNLLQRNNKWHISRWRNFRLH